MHNNYLTVSQKKKKLKITFILNETRAKTMQRKHEVLLPINRNYDKI